MVSMESKVAERAVNEDQAECLGRKVVCWVSTRWCPAVWFGQSSELRADGDAGSACCHIEAGEGQALQ